MGTIYKITNNINNKIYIGKTTQKVNRRWKDHRNAKNNMLIAKAIRKYGKENFTFEIVEDNIEDINLAEKEAFYILYFKSNDLKIGYNQCEVIGGIISHTEKVRKIQSETMIETHKKPHMKLIAKNNGLKRRGQKSNGTSIYVGVSLNKIGKYKYWRAFTSFNGVPKNLGNYLTEIEAAKRYDIEALQTFGKDCSLNFPDLRKCYLNNEVIVSRIKPKNKNTPKGISYITKKDTYRVRIKNKKDKTFKKLEDAIDYLNKNL